ncbi:hypothetical protein NNX28_14670 [Arthrobacter sp. zg-Y859]|uniref:Uncharacterized protein n=1 Tax=Arthrobacter jinronghuae TaxID=2964609 RepID=A0ABT1NWS4_9MICC|nr:hypothetical protein [Arthrobacter jinronghuae]MCQ1951164.1 hypothetical protein [Arthrobacter jinronghuae]UWX79061.1 hypothetical protein N2K98_02240 [Arthrobacter jinronghuae]
MDAALTGLTTRRYTPVQRDNFIAPLCAECNRRMIPNWVEDRSRWIINGFRYPGVRCSTHERRVLPEYFGLSQPAPVPNLRRDTATSARRPKAGSRFLGLGAKRAQRSA